MSNEDVKPEEQQPEVEEQQANAEGETVDAALETLENEQLSQVQAELDKALATVEEQKDSVLRARAEADNARRRADAEVDKAKKYALERFAGELLPVIDNLERALQSGEQDNEQIKPVMEGVELTLKSFLGTIEKFGMEVVDPQGEVFNPELHQAMAMVESPDAEPNTVLMVMQKGYQLNGRLLRPAMVSVVKASDGQSGVNTTV